MEEESRYPFYVIFAGQLGNQVLQGLFWGEEYTWESLGSWRWEHRKQSKGRDAQWLLHCPVHHRLRSKRSTDAIRPSKPQAAVLFREGSGLCWARAQSQGSFSSTAEFVGTCCRRRIYCRGETCWMLRAARSTLPGAL